MKKYLLLPLAGLAAMSQSAFAALDTAGVVTEISSNSTSVEAIGVAVLAVCAVILGIKLVKRIL